MNIVKFQLGKYVDTGMQVKSMQIYVHLNPRLRSYKDFSNNFLINIYGCDSAFPIISQLYNNYKMTYLVHVI